MKPSSLLILVFVSTLAMAQSRSYQALKDNFEGGEEVYSFSLRGFLCRAALSIALVEEDDVENEILRKAFRDINHVRLMVIPRREFEHRGLSLNGFRSYLKRDAFEELATVRDKKDRVTFYHRHDNNKKDRYFVLVEEPGEVVAVEMSGYIDPKIFKNGDNRISLYQK